MSCLIPHGKPPIEHTLWITQLGDDPCKKLLPDLKQMRLGGKRGGWKGPLMKRATTVAKRLIPLKGDGA